MGRTQKFRRPCNATPPPRKRKNKNHKKRGIVWEIYVPDPLPKKPNRVSYYPVATVTDEDGGYKRAEELAQIYIKQTGKAFIDMKGSRKPVKVIKPKKGPTPKKSKGQPKDIGVLKGNDGPKYSKFDDYVDYLSTR